MKGPHGDVRDRLDIMEEEEAGPGLDCRLELLDFLIDPLDLVEEVEVVGCVLVHTFSHSIVLQHYFIHAEVGVEGHGSGRRYS